MTTTTVEPIPAPAVARPQTQQALDAYAKTHIDDAAILRRFGHVVRRLSLAVASRVGLEADELWSVGALGLIDAVRRFDASRGVPLEAFVTFRVRGAMLDELRRLDRLPRRLRGSVGQLEKVRAAMAQKLGRDPTREELANALDMDANKLDELEGARSEPVALTDAQATPAREEAADLLVLLRERADSLRDAVAELPERLQTVLSLRYVEEMSVKDIAKMLGVSEPRVCQLHNAAVAKLRVILGVPEP
jgi:RNA polymerase sigma factor for flagellar operon FliA